MNLSTDGALVLIGIVAVLSPILAELTGRLAIPDVVFEIGLGIVIGPAVLGIAHPGSVIVAFEDMGLSYLMFLAGVELDIPRIHGRSLQLAITGWMISLALALLIASVLVVIGTVIDAVVMSLALTTTALGTFLPILRDAGLFEGRFGARVMAIGSVGEFAPILAVAVLLDHRNPETTSVLLVVFVVVAVAAALVASLPHPPRVIQLLHRHVQSSAQLLRAAGSVSPPVLPVDGADSPASSFAVGARLLEVVGDQQATGPKGSVAILIDDVQWADRNSVEALTFMLRRLSVDPVVAIVVYRGHSGRLDEAAQRLLLSIENRMLIPLGGLNNEEVASLAAALTTGSLDDTAVQRLHRCTGGHPLYLHTVLSEGSGFDPLALGQLALPRSLAAAVGDHLRALPSETRGLIEMRSVLNLRLPLAQLGQAAQIDSPSAAIEPAVASGLVDWSPEEPTCPVEIRHPLVRDAVYADITATRRRLLHARAAAAVSESASWEHWVAALDSPDESLAVELERLAGEEVASGRLVLGATHLRWASDISPARADRERRLLTAALHLTLAEESRDLALRPAVEAAAPSALRSCVLGTMAFSAGQLTEAERWFKQALAEARADPDSMWLAALIADRLAGTYILLGEGEKVLTFGRWALGTGCLHPAAASQVRTMIAIGASQVAGPRAALAEFAYLDADPARVGPVDVDGLAFRGVFRMAGGDLRRAISDLTAGVKMVRGGANLILGLRTYCYLALAQYLAGAWDDVLLTADQGLSAAAIHPHRYELPLLHLAARCVPAGRGQAEEAEQHARLAAEPPPAWTTARRDCTRPWPGPWSARRPATTWAWPTRWVPGATNRPWTAAPGCTRCYGGRCWPRAWSAPASWSRQPSSWTSYGPRTASSATRSRRWPGWTAGWLSSRAARSRPGRSTSGARTPPAPTARCIPPGCCWPTAGSCGGPATGGTRSSGCAGLTIFTGRCARRRSSPGPKRNWPSVIFRPTRPGSSSPCWR
jgi:Sodium/hydrogen exchanger family